MMPDTLSLYIWKKIFSREVRVFSKSLPSGYLVLVGCVCVVVDVVVEKQTNLSCTIVSVMVPPCYEKSPAFDLLPQISYHHAARARFLLRILCCAVSKRVKRAKKRLIFSWPAFWWICPQFPELVNPPSLHYGIRHQLLPSVTYFLYQNGNYGCNIVMKNEFGALFSCICPPLLDFLNWPIHM